MSFDLGNLSAFDPNPIPQTSLSSESALQALARDTTQLLVNEFLNLPRQRTDEGVYIQIPAPTTPLPREKPVDPIFPGNTNVVTETQTSY